MSDSFGLPVAVLVIEDDPGDFGLIRVHLRSAGLGHAGEGAPLRWAKTLAEGLSLARENKPDVVLLDLSLPDSSDIATVEALRAALPGVPIVVLTGNDDNALALQAVQTDAQDYLVKGHFEHDTLGRHVGDTLLIERVMQILQEAQLAPQPLELELTEDAEDRAIVNSIISLARNLGLKTIAEGVETEGQLAFLREGGCDEVQGYYYARPLPTEAFEAFLRQAQA